MTEATPGTSTDASVRLPAEQIPIGVERKIGSHTVTEDEVLAFGRDWDPQYFHVDAAAAEESDFGGLIASGIHTLAVFQRLSVETVLSGFDIIAGKQLRSVRFLRPVRPGDTLTGSMRVEEIEPAEERPSRRRLIRNTREPARQAGPRRHGRLRGPRPGLSVSYQR